MKYGAELFLLFAVAALVLTLWIPKLRYRRAINRPFPEHFVEILTVTLPVYIKMPAPLRDQWHRLINQFLYQKKFYGCAGLELTDEMRVTIAAQACLLVLNRKTRVYPEVKSILVYPAAFVAPRVEVQEAGVVTHQDQGLLGESWSNGRVILAWDHVRHGAQDFTDGQNLVLHEFAHQLDGESGSTNGAPLLASRAGYTSWTTVFSKEFEQLQMAAEHGRVSVMDHYGATNPAEFFAVATESFFEKPAQMTSEHPELFCLLKEFYQLDPMAWVESRTDFK